MGQLQTCRSARDIVYFIAAGLIPLGTRQMTNEIGRRQFISALGCAAAAFAVGTLLLFSMPFAKAQSPDEMCRAITDTQLRQSCFEKIRPKQASPVTQSPLSPLGDSYKETPTDNAVQGYSWIIVAAIAVTLWVAAIILKRRREKRQLLARYMARHSELMSKYNDQQIVARIMEGKIWQGMSEEQLVDSRGPPDDRDQEVYKTKIKQTWKYGRAGRNRFRERIYIENGTIVGWKQ